MISRRPGKAVPQRRHSVSLDHRAGMVSKLMPEIAPYMSRSFFQWERPVVLQTTGAYFEERFTAVAGLGAA